MLRVFYAKLAFVSLGALLLAAEVVSANSSLTFSMHEKDVYDIVFKSDAKDVELEPGIYAIDPKTGNSLPLLLGEVLNPNRYNKGILGYAGRSAGIEPHDLLAILDGRIVLLNHNTNPKNPASYLVLGGSDKSALDAVDVIHGTRVEIPKIQSLEDISVNLGGTVAESGFLPSGGRLALLSIRAPSPWGDGLTLAMIVEWGNSASTVRVHGNKAWVVGHRFLDNQALQRMFPLESWRKEKADPSRKPKMLIYAPAMIAKFKHQLSRLENNSMAKGWIDQIQRFENILASGLERGEDGEQTGALALGVPMFDLLSRTEVLEDAPIEPILNESQRFIGQTFEPNTESFHIVNLKSPQLSQVKVGRQDLMFLPTKELEDATIGRMPVDRDPKTGKPMFIPEYVNKDMATQDTDGDSYLFFSKRHAYLLAKNHEMRDEFQIVPVKTPVLAPTDQISFIRHRIVRDQKAFQVFLISKRKERSDKSEIHVLSVQESDVLTNTLSRSIYEGPVMPTVEMCMRLIEHEGDLFFDNVTPVRGPAAYLKTEKEDEKMYVVSGKLHVPKKTVPYRRILNKTNGMDQIYLRSLKESTVVDDYLYHREYDPNGAVRSHTGFYLSPKSMGAKAIRDSVGETFLEGYPLFVKTHKGRPEKTEFVIESKIIERDPTSSVNFPSVNVSLIPYTEKKPKKAENKKRKKPESIYSTEDGPVKALVEEIDASKFRLAVAITPTFEVSHMRLMDGALKPFEINYPYKSLAYAQIIQGYKGRSNEFFILLFTKQDDKIKGSVDGVMIAHGIIHWNASEPDKFQVELDDFKKIHKGPVPPGSLKSHLLMDAQGVYYWVEDPQADKDSTKYRVRKLSRPGEFVDHRMGHVLQLRELDHLKETDMGLMVGRARYGGRWEVHTLFSLTDAVSGLREYLDRRKGRLMQPDKLTRDEGPQDKAAPEEAPLAMAMSKPDERAERLILDSFEKYLDQLVTEGSPDALKHPKVIVVEPGLKEKFKLSFFAKLAEGQGPLSIRSTKLSYYHANAALDDVEVSEELQYLTSSTRNERKRLLYVDSDLLRMKDIQTRVKGENSPSDTDDEFYGFGASQKEREEVYPFAEAEQSQKGNLMVLLASEGRAKSVKGWKKLKNQGSQVPMLSIVTPQEWREIQSIHGKEAAAGVLDNFEMNYDFLTSSWTLWPPRTEKAPEEIKAIAKVPYKAEEMKVFPTLEKILTDAANGKLAGQQKIIIVPQELKSLLQKLIMLRWATNDPAASPWNHSNKRLALHKIMGGNNHQNVIQENFRAMRGAAHSRNSVFYSDLETIIRIGRPFTPASGQHKNYGFTIKDPVRSSRGYFIESEMKAEPEEDQSDDNFEYEPSPLDEGSVEYEEAEQLNMDLEDVSEQISDMREELEVLDRRRRAVGENDSAVRRTIEEAINSIRSEMEGLRGMRAALERRVMAFGESATPKSGDGGSDERGPSQRVDEKSAFPHMIWWSAVEGMAIQPRKRSGWSLKSSVDRRVATILIGTEEELQRLEADTSFESKFFNIREHFDILKLEAPDEQTKFNLVYQLFDRPEVSSLGIRFELKNNNGREPRSQLIYHFINRVDQVAFEEKIERTSAFIRAFIALKNSLSEDIDLRRNRVIDEKFIERLFTKVFPMPLKPEILEKTDPLNRMRDQDQAIRDLQGVGYEGSPDLKRRFFETILSQTRPTDTSRPIPNSQILFGGTSTGKTFLLESLFKMLNLVEYNPGKANNEDADYIVIKVQKLTSDESSDPDKMSVKDAIAQVLDLMSQPKGTRAHIVFDDFHKAASKGVREKLSQFIGSLFEAKNGMYSVRSKDGKRHREIPVQNLNLYMTINPASNERIRKEWVKESLRGNELLKREVLAALSGDGFTPEESFLARWGDIINLDNFPRSAKVPELVKRVRANAGKSGQMVLVDPQVIDTLIDRFPHAHARELLSPATAALTSLPPGAAPAPMYLVSSRPAGQTGHAAEVGGDSFSQHDLQHEVRKFTQVDSLKPNDIVSLARLMGFAMRNFRLHVLNYVALEAHMSDVLRVNLPGQANVLKTNFLLGLSTHVLDHPRIPNGEIDLQPELFGFLTRTQLEDLVKYQLQQKPPEPYFPVNLELQDRRDEMDLARFMEGTYVHTQQPKTRREVLIETVAKAELILRKAMRIYMRVPSDDQLREIGHWNEARIKDWFQNLSENEPEKEFRATTRELIELFYDFVERMHSPDLVRENGERVDLHLYDQVRLFSYVIDKAILRLPWGQIGNFTLNAAALSSDLSLGTRTGFREYVGSHQLSVFSIATPEFMSDMFLQATTGHGENLAGSVDSLKRHFGQVCESLLVAKKVQE